ncbi:MAG: IS110 family transposase [Janthinobacterium lividum]
METYHVILGVDVSKLTLYISYAQFHLHLKISNDSKGFNDFKKWYKSNSFKSNEVFVVLQHTGGYEYRFIQFLESQLVHYCRISGLEIKRSMGMTRGKSDKVDAFRISRYGKEKIRKLMPDKLLDTNIIKLKQLLSYRKQLVRESAGLLSTIKEREHIIEHARADTIISISKKKI